MPGMSAQYLNGGQTLRMPSVNTPVTTVRSGGLLGMGLATSPASISTVSAMAPMYTGSQLGPVVERIEPAQIITGGFAPMAQPQSSYRGGEVSRQEFNQLQAQMNGVLAELAACKARLNKLDPPETPLRAETRLVEQRGNIRVNHSTGHVQLLRNIAFHPRTTKDEPTAIFRDVNQADAICRDLAEVSNIFNCPMTIEGHTKGGESDFWQTLANRRAVLVAEKMMEFGAIPENLETRGLPGRMGKNEVRTEVYMNISNIKDESAAVQEVDIIVGGRVVERDLIQAGRLVEQDRVTATPVIERDVIGNQIVDRVVMAQTGVESSFIGKSGKTVERGFAGYAQPATYIR